MSGDNHNINATSGTYYKIKTILSFSLFMSVCLPLSLPSFNLFSCLYLCLSHVCYQFVCLAYDQSVFFSAYLATFLSVCHFSCQLICEHSHLSVCLSLCLPTCLTLSVFSSLPICLFNSFISTIFLKNFSV